MVHKARTPDERFIICAYQTAYALGDWSTPLNRYEVEKLAGINPKGADATCKLLIQANFIKKLLKKISTLRKMESGWLFVY